MKKEVILNRDDAYELLSSFLYQNYFLTEDYAKNMWKFIGITDNKEKYPIFLFSFVELASGNDIFLN